MSRFHSVLRVFLLRFFFFLAALLWVFPLKGAGRESRVDTANSAFVFGNKRVIFSGPGNFMVYAGERKIAGQYIIFSSPYSHWLSTKTMKLNMVKKYEGGSVCVTERSFDAEKKTFVMKGFFPLHAKDAPPSEYKTASWSQTARILPDGRLEIVFQNGADDTYMASRPRKQLNSFFFDLTPGITYQMLQPRIREKGLKESWRYYCAKLSDGKTELCNIVTDTPSVMHEYTKKDGFYFAFPQCRTERFLIDFPDYGEEPKHAPGGVDFKAADDLSLPENGGRNLLPNPFFAEGRNYIMDGGYECFPLGYAGKNLVTEPVLFGRYALGSGRYRLASVPADTGYYTFSFYLKGKGTYAVAMETKVLHQRAFYKDGTYDTQGEWKRFTFPFRFQGPGFIQPAVSFTGGTLDGLQLEKGKTATAFQAPEVSGMMIAPALGGNGFFESGKHQKISFELTTLQDRFQGDVTFTVRDFFRRTVLKQTYRADFRKGEYPGVRLNIPEKGFPDGIYTVEMRSPSAVAFFRFSVMPYLNNTHATAKIFSPSYTGHKGAVTNCPEHYLQRLQHVGYGCLGHLPVISPEVLKRMEKYGIIPFDSGCVFRAPTARYKKIFPELADKMQPGHVYFGIADKTKPSWDRRKEDALIADYRLLGGWSEEYKLKFQEAVRKVLKQLPGRLAYGMGGEMPDEIKNDPHYIDLLIAFFEAVKSVYPDALVYEGGAANMQILNGVAEVNRTLTRIGNRWPVTLTVCHPYNSNPAEFHDQFAAWLEMLKKHGLEKAYIAFPECMHYYPYGASLWECNPISAEKNCVRTAMSYDLGWTERMSAAYYARTYLTVLTQFQRMYCVTSAVTTTRNDYLDVDMTSRAGEKAVNTLGVLLGNPRKYLGDCSFAPMVRCFVWETEDGTPLAAVWSDDPKLATGYSAFPEVKLNYPNAEYTDLMGAKCTEWKQGTFPLSPFPLFIRGRKGDSVAFTDALKDAAVSGKRQFPCTMETAFSGKGTLEFTFRSSRARKLEGVFTVNRKEYAVSIVPGGRQTVSVPLPERPSSGKVHKINLPWTFRTGDDVFQGTFEETLLAVPRFTGEWKDIPAMAMPCYRKNSTEEPCGYPGDFDVTMQIAWTPEDLRFRVCVTDDVLTAGDEPKCRYNYDVCQLFMDTRCSARKSRINVFDDDDYDYELMPTADGKRCQVWRNASPFIQLTLGTAAPKDRQLAPEIPAAFTRTEKGYCYEVRIPKAFVLPIRMTPGWNFALGIYVADRDKGKSVKQARFLALDPNGGCWNRPLNWPIAVLAE